MIFRLWFFFIIYILFTQNLLGESAHSEHKSLPIKVRIGVVAYDDTKERLPYFTSLAKALLNNTPQNFQINYAFGTYEEIIHWAKEDLLDIAAVGPAVYLRMRNLGLASTETNTKYRLVAQEESKNLPIKCFTNINSKIKTLEDIKNAVARKELELLAPNMLSASGYIIPIHFLQTHGIKIDPSKIKFTYTHSNTLRLLDINKNMSKIACVWSGINNIADYRHLKSIDLPELEKISVPNNLLLVRNNIDWGNLAIQALIKARPKDFSSQEINSAELSLLSDMLSFVESSKTDPNFKKDNYFPIDDIVLALTQYATTQPLPPRLAVVLSGGGAKCAFQLGAVRALEQTLAIARKGLNLENLDIKLLVGTSGGAVNALPIAMGLTRSDLGFELMKNAWKDMDQREMLRPPFLVRFFLGLWLGAAQVLIYLNIRRIMTRAARRRVGVAFIILGCIEGLLYLLPYKPWNFLGTSSALHHFWLWISFGIAYSGLLLVFLGLITITSKRIRYMVCVSGSIRRLLVGLIVIFPFVQAWIVFIHEDTFTDGKGLEAVLVRNYQKILSKNTNNNSINFTLSSLSEAIINSSLLERDLVLTASPLSNGLQTSHPDLYFYLPSKNYNLQPQYDNKGVSLLNRKEDLMNVLLGSSAIYPVFPARKINNFPNVGSAVQLVDGSFSHRSPIEAAVLWEATHIVVIESSPIEAIEAKGFAANLVTALNHLYEQAQLTDLRARNSITVYTLFPEAPHIGLLDFSDNLIDIAIDKGYYEALQIETNRFPKSSGFLKELGEPKWWDPINALL
jgi:predicted acylesterase/phospholipase RssA